MSGSALDKVLGRRTTSILSAAAKDVVRAAAPNLGRAIGGPLGGVVEREIARAVSGEPDAAPAEVSAAIEAGDAETLARLAEAQAKLEAVGVDLARVRAEDRADARARQVTTDDPTPARLTYLAFAALCGAFAALLIVDPQGSTRDMLMVIVGALITLTKDGYGFHVGSSKGSKDKTALLGGER